MLFRGKADCVQRENECLHDYSSISRAEEVFLKQKSRNNWLNIGDQNFAYFHKLVKVRNSKNNTFSHVWDEDGQKIVNAYGTQYVVVAFYEKLLGSSCPVFDVLKADRVCGLLSKKVSDIQAMNLAREFTEVEVRNTVFAMKSCKAPRPDGFTAGFF
jgi:hypothetical protein